MEIKNNNPRWRKDLRWSDKLYEEHYMLRKILPIPKEKRDFDKELEKKLDDLIQAFVMPLKVIQRLESFESLSNDWADKGSVPPSKDIIQKSKDFIYHLTDIKHRSMWHLHFEDIVPTQHGTIMIEFGCSLTNMQKDYPYFVSIEIGAKSGFYCELPSGEYQNDNLNNPLIPLSEDLKKSLDELCSLDKTESDDFKKFKGFPFASKDIESDIAEMVNNNFENLLLKI